MTGRHGLRRIGAVERCSVQRRTGDVLQVVQRVVQLALKGDSSRKDDGVHAGLEVSAGSGDVQDDHVHLIVGYGAVNHVTIGSNVSIPRYYLQSSNTCHRSKSISRAPAMNRSMLISYTLLGQ